MCINSSSLPESLYDRYQHFLILTSMNVKWLTRFFAFSWRPRQTNGIYRRSRLGAAEFAYYKCVEKLDTQKQYSGYDTKISGCQSTFLEIWRMLSTPFIAITSGCPRGVMVKAMDLRNRSKRVRIPVVLLRSLSGKSPWEGYELPYPPSYGLNSTTTVLLGDMALALNNLEWLICH